MTDDVAKTSLIYDAAPAKAGAAEFHAASEKVIADSKRVGEASEQSATKVVQSEQRAAIARKAQGLAAQDAARLQVAAAAAGGDAMAKASERTVASLQSQTTMLQRYAKSFDPLNAAVERTKTQLANLSDVASKGGPNAARATELIAVAQTKLAAQQKLAAGTTGELTKMSGAAAFAMRDMGLQSIDLFQGIATGQPIMRTFLQQAAQVVQVNAGMGIGFRQTATMVGGFFTRLAANPLTWIVGAIAGLAALGAASENTARRMGALRNQLGGIRDDAAGAARMVDDAARHLAQTTSLGTTESRQAGQSILSQREFVGSQRQLEELIQTADQLAIRLNTDLPHGADILAHALKDPSAVVKELTEKGLKGFNARLLETVHSLEATGHKGQAFDAVLAAVRAAAAGATRELTPLQAELAKLWQAFTTAGAGGKSLADGIGAVVVSVTSQAVKEINELILVLERVKAILPTELPWWMDPAKISQTLGAGALHDWLQRRGLTLDQPGSMPTPATQGTVDRLGLGSGAVSGGGRDVNAAIRPSTAAMLQEASESSGVGIGLLGRVYNSEHAFNPDGSYKTSSKGAVGGMQVMPDTFAEMAGKYGIKGPITDERSNIMAGAYYLAEQIKAKQDIGLGLASYNAGPKRAGDGSNLPDETKQYVARILAGYAPGAGINIGQAGTTPIASDTGSDKGFDMKKAESRLGEIGLQSRDYQAAKADVILFTGALEKLRLEGKTSGKDFDQFSEALRKSQLALQDAISPADKLTQGLDRQLSGQERIAAAYRDGEAAVIATTARVKAEADARTLAAAGLGEYATLVETLTQKYQAEADVTGRIALNQQMLANDNSLAMIKAETETLTMNNTERVKYLAALQAELQLKAQGKPINDDYAKSVIASNVALATGKLELDNQTQALSGIAGVFENSFSQVSSSITNALASGQGAFVNFRTTAVSTAQAILSEFLKLSILNPLMNSIFGGNRQTMGGIIDTLGSSTSPSGISQIGGWFGKLFGSGATTGGGEALIDGTMSAATSVAGSGGWLSGIGDWIGKGFTSIMGLFHEGGMVGLDGIPRLVPAVNLNELPRFHTGLGGDEFAAILQRGERVLTQSQQKQVAAAAGKSEGGTTITINMSGVKGDRDTLQRAGQQIANQLDASLERARSRNGTRG